MANELTLTITASWTKNGVPFSKSFSSQFTTTGSNPVSSIDNVGTSDGTLPLGGITTPGFLIGKNKDATNYLLLGGDGTNYFDKLKAGEFMAKRWNGAAIHRKANVAACDFEYLLIPD
jgi:hypothetical protein